MLIARLNELRQQADPRSRSAGPDWAAACGRSTSPRSSPSSRPTARSRALEALLTEAERVRRFGFTDGELDRARAEVVNGLDRALAERDQQPSRAYASALVDYDLEGGPRAGPSTTATGSRGSTCPASRSAR